jgi:nascent polypeptide-associated complex subunit alpha
MKGIDKKTKKMMKQMGIDVKPLNDVEEVVIKTTDRELIFKDAKVMEIGSMGVKTYQIVGTPEERKKEVEIPEEDIRLVVEKTGVEEEEAMAALKSTKGDLAAAIMKLIDISPSS